MGALPKWSCLRVGYGELGGYTMSQNVNYLMLKNIKNEEVASDIGFDN